MLMVLLLCLLPLAGTESVGVCFTRNEVGADTSNEFHVCVDDFAEVFASLVTLQESSISSCLFTSVSEGAAQFALRSLVSSSKNTRRTIAPRILPSADGEAIARKHGWFSDAMEARLGGHSAQRAGSNLWRKAKALVARAANLANSPFDVTLFLDADTAVCPTPRLGDLLINLATVDARIAELPSSKGKPRAL
eukprot:CAMPEP_0118907774 /NCGR_PEP_ID=MMETSP1166-20130328/11077_1 /TAXON_ID=1104430 /ORGANISM="Chrysoreinhardia sp, Strain CCMP3193" /LENGTH=192 /DNA_ID=CAMNT_0006847149 /DNA_START=41 /DNA_END=616 /DNA_ORIENTATION=-